MANRDVSAEMVQELEAASAAWLEMAIRELKASAKKNKLELTGGTIESIAGSISAFSPEAVGEIIISFQNSARFLDYRKQSYKRQAPVDALAEWVERVGLDKFKTVPGYRSGTRPVTDSLAARRIAWGIAVSRARRGPGKKRKWFAGLMFKPLLARLIQAQIEILGTSSVRVVADNLTFSE